MLLVVSVVLAGCEVDKHQAGKGDDVKIATPFGGLSVDTDNATVEHGIGMALYPGAVPEKKDNDNGSAADVNLGFGNFHLSVKALSFTSPDPSDKVLAFYRKDLARFGAVITCRDHKPVGSPARTPEGLTCASDSDSHAKVSINNSDYDEELKAGSRHHQHIVAVESKGAGTKFGLILLDLPTGLDRHSSGADDDGKQ
jgi:hypothetical protein